MVRPRGIGPSSITSSASSHTARTRSTSPISSFTNGGLAESLPDVYRFSNRVHGVNDNNNSSPMETSTSMARQLHNPFVPSSPRIGEDEKFNFDHGALMSELEETSYMAWFWAGWSIFWIVLSSFFHPCLLFFALCLWGPVVCRCRRLFIFLYVVLAMNEPAWCICLLFWWNAVMHCSMSIPVRSSIVCNHISLLIPFLLDHWTCLICDHEC